MKQFESLNEMNSKMCLQIFRKFIRFRNKLTKTNKTF